MCKTPFGSQGVILDGFKQIVFKTFMARETPLPLHGKCNWKFPFFLILPLPPVLLQRWVFPENAWICLGMSRSGWNPFRQPDVGWKLKPLSRQQKCITPRIPPLISQSSSPNHLHPMAKGFQPCLTLFAMVEIRVHLPKKGFLLSCQISKYFFLGGLP